MPLAERVGQLSVIIRRAGGSWDCNQRLNAKVVSDSSYEIVESERASKESRRPGAM
jgi:hypothetical protein